jgi:UMF1 family MFS transporter
MGFAYATCVIGICILFVFHDSQWWLTYIIYILSNVTFGASFVFFYSWVPILTRWHPNVIKASGELDNGSGQLGKASNELEYYRECEKMANLISARGFAWSYVAAVVELIIGIFIFNHRTFYCSVCR